MKTYLVVLAAMFMVSVYAYAVDMNPGGMSVTNDTGTVNQNNMLTDYVTMREGSMIVVRNGFMSLMNRDIAMPNGTVVMKDGVYRLRDGTMRKMINGDKMDMNGSLIK